MGIDKILVFYYIPIEKKSNKKDAIYAVQWEGIGSNGPRKVGRQN